MERVFVFFLRRFHIDSIHMMAGCPSNHQLEVVDRSRGPSPLSTTSVKEIHPTRALWVRIFSSGPRNASTSPFRAIDLRVTSVVPQILGCPGVQKRESNAPTLEEPSHLTRLLTVGALVSPTGGPGWRPGCRGGCRRRDRRTGREAYADVIRHPVTAFTDGFVSFVVLFAIFYTFFTYMLKYGWAS